MIAFGASALRMVCSFSCLQHLAASSRIYCDDQAEDQQRNDQANDNELQQDLLALGSADPPRL